MDSELGKASVKLRLLNERAVLNAWMNYFEDWVAFVCGECETLRADIFFAEAAFLNCQFNVEYEVGSDIEMQ